MHRPVLVEPPAAAPVSLAEAEAHILDVPDDQGALIEGLIAAATQHLDGWTGILGACMVEQEWRQDFDCFARCLPLPLGPVMSITHVRWRNKAGQMATVNQDEYSLRTDGGGRSFVRFRDSYQLPSDLYQVAAVQVTYKAGHEEVPAPLKVAILLTVAHWFNHREAVVTGIIATTIPMGAKMLIAPFRRVRI